MVEIKTESSAKMFFIQLPNDFDPGMMLPRRMKGEKIILRMMLTYDLRSIQKILRKVIKMTIRKIRKTKRFKLMKIGLRERIPATS